VDKAEIVKARKTEQAKYSLMYQKDWYKMGSGRRLVCNLALKNLNPEGLSLVDVGCGRGEFIQDAKKLGCNPVFGIESTFSLVDLTKGIRSGEITHLPLATGGYDIVTCFDVLEHIPAFDTELALSELKRVGKKHWLITAADYSHVVDGIELHVNARPYPEWEELLKKFWPTVRRIYHPQEDFTALWYCSEES